jgi:AP-1 complex subunit gamma-1
VLDLMDLILASPYANTTIRQFVLTSITKLSTRFSADSAIQLRIRTMLDSFGSSHEVEIQQRAVEFGELLKSLDGIRVGVLERMPPPELKVTVMGTVSEKRAVGSTRTDKDVSISGDVVLIQQHVLICHLRRCSISWETNRLRPPRP